MADSKITALDNLTSADPANDMIPIVDVSATPPASGNTKRISINNLLACSPSATLASATITGDLTVNTNVLKVDSTNDRVGIGTASPSNSLDVIGSGAQTVRVGSSNGDLAILSMFSNGNATWSLASDSVYRVRRDATEHHRIDATGVATWSNVGGGAGTAMTLNSTGLGVGDAPAANSRLTIGSTNATGFQYALRTTGITTGRSQIYLVNTSGDLAAGIEGSTAGASVTGSAAYSAYIGTATSNPFYLVTGGTVRATVDTSGNVGIGVTPSAWTSSDRALQFAYGNSIATATSTNFSIARNAQELAGGWTYSANGFVQLYNLESDGGYKWYTAISGIANNVVSFGSAKMTLDTLGNLILLSPSTPPTLATNGQLTVNATSNTNLRFSYRGSDGVTRTANLTLA